jgi:hypothetical protein
MDGYKVKHDYDTPPLWRKGEVKNLSLFYFYFRCSLNNLSSGLSGQVELSDSISSPSGE